MKTILVFAVYGVLWGPGIWLVKYVTDVYGSVGNGPFMLSIIEFILISYPWYFAIGPGEKYIERFFKFIHVDLEEKE